MSIATFTEIEVESIISDYLSGASLGDLSLKYNKKSCIILTKLKSKGVYVYKNNRWTKSEIEILRELYPSAKWDVILKALYPRPKENIIHKAYKLKISRECYGWTEKELDILINGYKNNYSITRIAKLLGNKFKDHAIYTKAHKMGLVQRHPWTIEEDNILRDTYGSLLPLDIERFLSDKNAISIKRRAHRLGLVSCRYWTPEDTDFLINNYNDYSDSELALLLNKSEDSIRCKRNQHRLIRVHKGIYDSLSEYVRQNNTEWKTQSLKRCQYKCFITGNRVGDIHHIHGMNLIIKEVCDYLEIDKDYPFCELDEETLNKFSDEFKRIQSKYPFGACMTTELHKEFHSIYGFGNNTIEQFKEFLLINGYPSIDFLL